MISTLNQLLQEAKNKTTKKLVIAAAEDKYVLNAIAMAEKEGLINPIYVGDSNKIAMLSEELNISIAPSSIIDIKDSNKACEKAVRLVSEGKADLLMKGLVSTGTLLKHVISKEYGLLSGTLLSHLAVFESPNYHKLLGLSDAAMNISPSINEKAGIINNAVSVFHSLGISIPKTAILTAVEKVNPKMPATTDAVALKGMCERKELDNCIVDGPLALDNAISKEAAMHKGIDSPVAGDADILIAPDINTGNVLYKALSFLGNARCAAIITGSKAPIILTSRADSEETKFLSIALGVMACKE